MLLAFGDLVQAVHPGRFGAIQLRVGAATVNRLAPHFGDLCHISRTALAAFDLDGAHADFHQFGQQGERVQAGGLFNGVVVMLVTHIKAALAQRGITGVFTGGVAVNQHAVQARLAALRRFNPAHRFGRRADTIGVGRFAGHVAGQGAAPLHHHAQAAKAKHLDLDRGFLQHLLNLRERQHTRQHGARNAKVLVIKIKRLVVGGRALHRQVQAQLRLVADGISHHAGVGQDDGINPAVRGAIDRALPELGLGRLRVGVERHKHLAPALMRVANAGFNGGFVKIEAGKVARVGGIAKAEVNAVGAVVNRRLERGQAAGRANQFHGGGAGRDLRGDKRIVRNRFHHGCGIVGHLDGCVIARQKRQAN